VDSVSDEAVIKGLIYINKLGSYVSIHQKAQVARGEAALSLRSLFDFAMFLSYTYSENFTARSYNESELSATKQIKPSRSEEPLLSHPLFKSLTGDIDSCYRSIDTLDEITLTALETQKTTNTAIRIATHKPIDEAETRRRYINIDLKAMGWVFGENCFEEYEVKGMPNNSGDGKVDYVLFGDNGKPLAVVEAKRTTIDHKTGKTQAQLYANCLKNKFGQRPLIFYTNGYKTSLWDDVTYPAREVYSVFSKNDLQYLIDRRSMRAPLKDKLDIDPNITDRYYQKEAIQAVCTGFQNKARNVLLVMATGTGKTRTVVSLVDVLCKNNWVTNILFLADRCELLKQAKETFNRFLPKLSSCNLTDRGKDNPAHRAIFSTYQTIMHAINNEKTDEGVKLFTPSHFQLIIFDEAHRSIFNKYRAIFKYFDALLVGLTATPKNDIEGGTYKIFNLQPNMPTYAYEYQTAVHDNYLVDYHCVEKSFKILTDGIHRPKLTEEEKLLFDGFFEDNEIPPDDIDKDDINKIYFNIDTTRQILTELMTRGLKVEGNDKLGKTIIFARSHRHAEFIFEQFNLLYPQYKGNFARVIDNYEQYSAKLITDFKDKNKLPQIAISVDMLDTGIDVPEILNLVFFKTIHSKIKFWQMIGRGTRLCDDIFGPGENKKFFYIFDYLENFEYHRTNQNGVEAKELRSLFEIIFSHKVRLIKELQPLKYQTAELISFRNNLIDDITTQIGKLNRDHFHVRLELERVQKYSDKSGFVCLTDIETQEIIGSLARLICPSDDDYEYARRLDALAYQLELAYLNNEDNDKKTIVPRIKESAQKLAQKATIPQVLTKRETIERVQQETFWSSANILDIDIVRKDLRDLMQYLKKEFKTKVIDMPDTVIFHQEGVRLPVDNTLETYYQRAARYIRDNKNNTAISKLKNNDTLTETDWIELERIFWSDIGSEEEYRKSCTETEYAKKHGGELPLGKFIRSITGLSREAATRAFSAFLDERLYSSEQIYFVKCIIDKVVIEGTMEREELRNEEFSSRVSWLDAFKDNTTALQDILETIDKVNTNAMKHAV
jgi:type I restriction enzyme R subunit